ncbi:Hypothetical predicted protein [Paramuricea clavata]|uniref:Uncharacterized protein n=1 Tax=Paramuricea clavata TaxID=317549 RepID=A0A7D9LZR8_PARCT|nr:Hypothetical predicted protein [Paramuricea clavata]
MMQGDQTMNTSASSEAQDVNSIDVLEVIVNEVQAHPILWSRRNPDYKRSDKKRIVWSAIAQKVGLEVEQVKLKWKNLSDGFKKCLDRKRDLEKSGSGYSKQPTCRFYNQLLFLRDSISNRTTQSNVPVRSISPAIPSPSEKALPEPSTHVESNPGNKASQQNQQQAVPPQHNHQPNKSSNFHKQLLSQKRKRKLYLIQLKNI